MNIFITIVIKYYLSTKNCWRNPINVSFYNKKIEEWKFLLKSFIGIAIDAYMLYEILWVFLIENKNNANSI